MKKVLLFLVLLAGVGGTGYLCAQSGETVSVWKDADYQQENAVEVQLAVEEETTETTVETTVEATTEAVSETVQSTLPDYEDAIGTYVVTVSSALADTAGGQTGASELGVNLVVAVTAQEIVNGTTWDQVEYYGMSGWMPDADLIFLGDGQKLQESTAVWLFVEPGTTVTVYDESCTAEERAALTAGESTQAAEAGTLSYGPELTVEEADGDWVRITSGETSGWIPAVYAASYYPNTSYCADTNINLRSGPAADDEKVGTLTKGTTVIPEQIQGGWVKVESGGISGWAALYYMTPCADSDGEQDAAGVTPTSAPVTVVTAAAAQTTDNSAAAAFTSGTASSGSQTTVTESSAETATSLSGGESEEEDSGDTLDEMLDTDLGTDGDVIEWE